MRCMANKLLSTWLLAGMTLHHAATSHVPVGSSASSFLNFAFIALPYDLNPHVSSSALLFSHTIRRHSSGGTVCAFGGVFQPP